MGIKSKLIARTELHKSFIDEKIESFKELKVAMVVNIGAY